MGHTCYRMIIGAEERLVVGSLKLLQIYYRIDIKRMNFLKGKHVTDDNWWSGFDVMGHTSYRIIIGAE